MKTTEDHLDAHRRYEPDEAAIERAVAILLRDKAHEEGEAA